MRKKISLILIILLIFIIIYNIILCGSKEYSHNIEGVLYIPKTSFIKEYNECFDFYLLNYDNNHHHLDSPEKKCINHTSFSTLQAKRKIEKELKENYEVQMCNNEKKFFYDPKNNITIIDYFVDKDNLFTILNLDYVTDRINIDDCNMIFTNIEYKYDYSYKYDSSEFVDYKYYDKDGKYYSIYSDCENCLTIKNGTGTYMTLKSMLGYGYVDIELFLQKLDNEVEAGISTKEIYKDGTMYQNETFDLYMCKNKKIIISDEINYNEKICEI